MKTTKLFFASLLSFVVSVSQAQTQNQKRDSALYPDPVKVPDTQRTPPHKSSDEDIPTKKLTGGALIDTVTPDKKSVPPDSIDVNKRKKTP